MSSDEKTTLSFVSEVGTFGSMGIRDTTVVKAELDEVTENCDPSDIRNTALRDYLNQNKNRKDD